MIVTKEFIWKENHFVCHITEEKNMPSIIEKGLLPLNGKRCGYINDERKGVFGLDGICNVQEWAEVLYEKADLETLRLLRFNLKGRKWYIDSSNIYVFGLYLPNKVLPQEIDYLQMIDQDGKELPFTKLFDLDFLYRVGDEFNNIERNTEIIVDDCNLSWKSIKQYTKK